MSIKTNQPKETMQLTKEDKKLLIRALDNLEQNIYNWSDNYIDTENKKYNGNILNAIDKVATKIINNK
jgi:succinate dehydrogenase flavin-adding protein (antitoxin of CptAB toxin-antitoxin module)